jgi:N6-L-threonylcarbamoyladenine synthase
MKILAIETSCDETAAAVIEDGTIVLSNSVASSQAMHEVWGGIVPEVAAREQLKSIIPVVMEALSIFIPEKDRKNIPYESIIKTHIDAIAVTVGPGLIGSLLIGVEAAKTIAFVTGKPIIPVNHVLAHMFANMIYSSQITVNSKPSTDNRQPISYPAISLVASGGHTELFLMKSPKDLTWLGGTIDDAAGEAFDKTARLLGFGAGGGVAIQNAAKQFTDNGSRFTDIKLPRPLLHDDTLNFSFSGLKTAVVREWNKYAANKDEFVSIFAYEVQEAITDVLVAKTLKAVEMYEANSILVSGGVSANVRLREKFASTIEKHNSRVTLHVPPFELCTDNAVAIGSYAYFYGKTVRWETIEAKPNLSVEEL